MMKSFIALVISRGKGAQTSLHLFKLLKMFVLILLSISCVSANLKVDCSDLEKRYDKRGYLPPKERVDYCMGGCIFLNIQCKSPTKPKSFVIDIDFDKMFNKTYDWLVNEDKESDSVKFDDDIIDAWFALAARVGSIALCSVPIILNQWKYYNFWSATILTIMFICLFFAQVTTFAIGVHNTAVAILCLLHSSNSGYLIDSMWTVLLLLLPFFTMFIVDYVWQIVLALAVFCGFVGLTCWMFFKKRRSNDAVVMLSFLQIFVAAEQLQFVRDHFGDKTICGAMIDLCLHCIMPGGDSSFFLRNAATKGSNLLSLMFDLYPRSLFMALVVGQVFFAIAFRVALGTYYLYSLRYRTDINSLLNGAYVYGCDAFGPFVATFSLVFNQEVFQIRRVNYVVVGVVMCYYESQFARGLWYIRVGLSLADLLFFKSRYGAITHYVGSNHNMMQAAYPQRGAPPWKSLRMLQEIADHVYKISVKNVEGTVGGIGFMLCSAGKDMLYSVLHVTKGAVMVKIPSKGTISSPDFRNISSGDDPITAMKYCCEEKLPAISMLMREEVRTVASLEFINVDPDGDKFTCSVPSFKVIDDKLYATVNLKPGDSGGPVFAVMPDGILKLCGVVSRGNPRMGGGNIISFCYHSDRVGDYSSDEESLGSVQQFNRVRRVKHASDDPSILRHEHARGLRQFITDHRDEFRAMKQWTRQVEFDDLERDEDTVVYDMIGAEHRADNMESRRKDDDDYENAPGGGKNRKRVKSAYKNKAARKAGLCHSKILWEKLKHVYSMRDAKNIFDTMVQGNVPTLSDRDHIQSFSPHGWVISDSLPASEWT